MAVLIADYTSAVWPQETLYTHAENDASYLHGSQNRWPSKHNEPMLV